MTRIERIGNATLYLGDCREILPDLSGIDAVVTDPPYGMGWDPDTTRFSGGDSARALRRGAGRGDWSSVIADDVPFDPTHLLSFKQVICWGSNHYTRRLPTGTTLVWIKRLAAAFGSFLSDAEIGWEKGNHGVYCYQQVFEGARRRIEGGGEAAHPTQKPVGLMAWCIARTQGLVCDPYCGSGTTGVAALGLGRKFIGIEVDAAHFDTACRRIEAAYRQRDLFIDAPVAADPADERAADLFAEPPAE